MKTIRVYTFAHRNSPLRAWRKSNISAYTRWANPSWPGCVVFDIEAETSAEAKKLAIARRFAEEQAKEAQRDA